MIDKMQIAMRSVESIQVSSKNQTKTLNSNEISFKAVLDEQLKGKDNRLQMSKHAKERIVQRGIDINSDLLDSLNSAANLAKSKGAKDIVMIGRDAAFVVNIPNGVIVTAVSSSELKDNIFTNIDSAVLI